LVYLLALALFCSLFPYVQAEALVERGGGGAVEDGVAICLKQGALGVKSGRYGLCGGRN